MIDTFPAVSLRGPVLPSYNDETSVGQPRAFYIFKKMSEIIVFVFFILHFTVGFTILYLISFVPKPLTYWLSAIFFFILLWIGHVLVTCFKGMDFIVNHRHYEIGDLIQIYQPGSRPNHIPDKETAMRVKDFTLLYTELVSLSTGEQQSWSNALLHRSSCSNWSDASAIFEIILEVGSFTRYCDCDLLLEKLGQTIQQYANDHPREWSLVNIPSAHSLTNEYCVEIRHCKKWHEFDTIMASKAKLMEYVAGLNQAGNLESEVSVTTAPEEIHDESNVNDDDDGDCKSENTDEDKIEKKTEKGNAEVDEEDQNGTVRRINYRIFVR